MITHKFKTKALNENGINVSCFLDNKELHGVKGYTINHECGEFPSLGITLQPKEIECDVNKVYVENLEVYISLMSDAELARLANIIDLIRHKKLRF